MHITLTTSSLSLTPFQADFGENLLAPAAPTIEPHLIALPGEPIVDIGPMPLLSAADATVAADDAVNGEPQPMVANDAEILPRPKPPAVPTRRRRRHRNADDPRLPKVMVYL